MNTTSRDLLERLRNIITKSDDGSIGFDEYMRETLYDPQLGYYAQGRENAGRYALFSVHPATAEVYAQVLGLQLEQMWYWLDQPEPFTIVEEIPGDARLLRYLLRWMRTHREEFFQATNIALVEPFEANRSAQQQMIGSNGLQEKCRWVSQLSDLGEQHLQGVFLSNEHAGSLPTLMARHDGAHWQELRVAWDERTGRPAFGKSEVNTESDLARALEHWQVPAVRNFRAEICLELGSWLESASGIFDTGFLLITDLGYDAGTLYHPNRINGSLTCRHGDKKFPDPFAQPGAHDIQCAVNFSALEYWAEQLGLVSLGTLRHSDAMKALAHASYVGFRDEQGASPDPEAAPVLQGFRNLLFPPIRSSSYRMLILADGFDANDPPHLACYGAPESEE